MRQTYKQDEGAHVHCHIARHAFSESFSDEGAAVYYIILNPHIYAFFYLEYVHVCVYT